MAVLLNRIKLQFMNVLGNEVESCSCGLKVGSVDFDRWPIIVISDTVPVVQDLIQNATGYCADATLIQRK